MPGWWWVATPTQWKALLLLYPFWVYLEWSTAWHIRHNSGLAFFSTTGSYVAAHLATIAILNDSFYQSRQQLLSMLFGLGVQHMWTLHQYLAFSCSE